MRSVPAWDIRYFHGARPHARTPCQRGKEMAANLISSTHDEALEERISRLLVGAVDLHCHSGPSVMPRDLNHIEAMQEAAAAGFRAMLIKDHYYLVLFFFVLFFLFF